MQQETTELMVRRVTEIERLDEEQIVKDLGGELVEDFVYEFPGEGGKMVKGLSWAGTREIAAMRGNIALSEPKITEGDDHWRVVVNATDLQRNITVWGGVHQQKLMKVYDRENGRRLETFHFEPDPFGLAKAVAKAQRNAIRNLIPTSIQRKIIAEFDRLKQGKTGRVNASTQVRPRNDRPAEAPDKAQEPLEFQPVIEAAKNLQIPWTSVLGNVLKVETWDQWKADGGTVQLAIERLNKYVAENPQRQTAGTRR